MDRETPLIEAEVLLDRIRALQPVLRERAAETERRRMVLPETIRDLFAAELFRHFQPRRYGGHGLPWGIQYDIGRLLAHACPSTAWIATVVAANNAYACRFDPRVQAEIYGKGPDVLVTNGSVQKGVTIASEAGGYRVNGAWGFASGIDHADWVMVGGAVDADKLGAAAPRIFLLLPKSDYSIDDTWFVSGMRGTGTKDVVTRNIFVPAWRTLTMQDFWGPNPAGAAIADDFIYRRDLGGFFGTSLLGPLIGMAEAGIATYLDQTRVRQGVLTKSVVAAEATVQIRVAESLAEVKAAATLMDLQMARLRAVGEADGTFTQGELLEMNRDRAFAVRLCQTALERLVSAMGAMGLQDANPAQRYFRDLNAAATQIAVNYDRNMAPFGRHALGLEVPKGFGI